MPFPGHMTLPVGKDRIIQKVPIGPDGVVVRHEEAHRDGLADRAAGKRQNAEKWPSGTYGHASYECAYWGEVDADA